MCLAVAALTQPYLVWCFESNGQVNLECAVCCCGLPASASQSEDHSLKLSSGGACETCFDVPISLRALNVNAAATELTLKLQAQYMASTVLHSENSFIPPCDNISRHYHSFSQSLHSVHSTILLI